MSVGALRMMFTTSKSQKSLEAVCKPKKECDTLLIFVDTYAAEGSAKKMCLFYVIYCVLTLNLKYAAGT